MLALAGLVAGCGGLADGDPVAELPGAVHRFADVDDRRWHWVEAGEGEALVLLHGMPQSWFAWRHQVESLSGTHRVLAPDLPGFGLSGKGEGDYSPAAVGDAVAALLRSLDLAGVTLVGHDWGGLVGAWVAARHPALVDRYVHVCAPLESFDLGRLPDYRDFHDNPDAAARLMDRAELFVSRVMEHSIHGGLRAYPREALDRHVRELRRRGTTRAVARYFRDLDLGPGNRLGENALPPWSRLQMPVLLVTADRDLVQPLEAYLDAGELIPGLRDTVTIDEAGHYPHEERPEALSRALRDFLEVR